MNERVKRLRDLSQSTVYTISHERAELVTDYYKNSGRGELSIPVQRAEAFKYIMENKELYIGDDELIVGERGPLPRAAVTYPEICIHSIEDLEILNDREKVNFLVSDETKKVYTEKIIPYWKGCSIRDKVFRSLDEEWKEAYSAGIFTEFQEQRAPGHTVLSKKMFFKGLNDLINEIDEELNNLNPFDNPQDYYDRTEELKAMKISCQAMVNYANRYSDKLKSLAENETNLDRKNELITMAEICRKVPANAPENFYEALQHYWFIHLGVITETNPWDSFNPGRLDQNLYPYYRKAIEAGIGEDELKELLGCFWIKFNNHPSPPKTGVTAKESNTYTDFALINLGGVKEDGSDAVNDLTYLILDIIEDMRLLQPSSMVQVSKKNPDIFIKRTLKILGTGFGQPSIFNTDAIISELIRQGKDIVDARNGGASGCVETGAFGTESYILTGYFNLNKILELTLNRGVDLLTGNKIGLDLGYDFSSMDELLKAYDIQLNHFMDIKIKGNVIIESIYARHMPVPFLSVLTEDCIKNGKDYNNGGARYNTSYVQGVGLGTITDQLSALNFHVYEKESISLNEIIEAIKDNFEGYSELRNTLLNNTPKYGNDDDRADKFASTIFEIFYNSVNGRKTARGGDFRINMLPTTSHVYFGGKLGATVDGRLARKPISEGISPVQGMDRNGPTAVINSASKIDHLRTGGTLLNQRFSYDFFGDDKGLSQLTSLVRSYFRMDGHHIQFNVVSANVLKLAKQRPEDYSDLIVRVAGYSDYFKDLTPELQDEIIERTEHCNF
ncbi:MAG: glycyl radical protein [Candidatus Delongbacteria bacterium]|nr:glycyl radical protein [Candidatus Delongbacteria bacterium]MBN2834587.1 glycyl radical protein [Candidatus Delongbacteria bacterium]